MSDAVGYQANLQRGQLLRLSGQYAQACPFLRRAIEADVNQPQAYLELALAEAELPGRKTASLQAMDRAVALAPDSTHFLGFKAYLLSHFGRHQEGYQIVQRALEINPRTSIVWLAKANIHTKLGQWPDAEAAARHLLQLNAQDTSALNLLAQALRFLHRHEESQQVITQILRLVPNDSFGQTNAGYEALKTQDLARAHQHFLNALRVNPRSEHARLGLMETLRSRLLVNRMFKGLPQFSFYGKNKLGRLIGIFLYIVCSATFGADPQLMGCLVLFFLFSSYRIAVSNFFLMFHPLGRRILTRYEQDQAIGAVGVGGLMLVVTVVYGYYLVAGCLGALFAFFILSFCLPIGDQPGLSSTNTPSYPLKLRQPVEDKGTLEGRG